MDIVINAELISMPDGVGKIPHQANFYHNILTCLEAPFASLQQDMPPVGDGLYPPLANILSHYHGLKGDWLIMSPLHWEATHNDAMITALGHELNLSNKESQQWFDVLSDFLAPLNYTLYYQDAYTWLIQCVNQPQITAKPIHSLLHQSIMPELKCLDDTLFWQRFITETQMFLGDHPLNKARKGLHPINGVWIWGAGPLPRAVETPVICNNLNLLRMAKILSNNVTHGPLTQKPVKHSVLLLNDLSQPDRLLLEDQLQSYTVRWYWNNMAYLTKPKRWWSRILGII